MKHSVLSFTVLSALCYFMAFAFSINCRADDSHAIQKTKEYAVTKAVVFSAVLASFQEIGISTKEVNAEAGIVNGDRFSGFSFGAKMTHSQALVESTSEGKSRVSYSRFYDRVIGGAKQDDDPSPYRAFFEALDRQIAARQQGN